MHLLSNVGRVDEAVAEIARARQLDPTNLVVNAIEGHVLSSAGRSEDAERVLRATIDMDSSFWLAHLFLSRVYLGREMYGEAIETATRAREMSDGNAEATATVGYALARSGRAEEARTILLELEERAGARFVPAYALAQIHLALGERSQALDLLEQALERRESMMVFLKVDPKWDDLRSDPRFAALLDRMNL